jgi:ornithine cyclodeaminase/alanine dehydrogenase-like protein (mu-crystallin family)
MSDPLSIAASVLAVVGAGCQVAKGLYQLADGIRSAGIEVRVYADEVDSFTKLLQRIRDQLLQRPAKSSTYEDNLLQDIVDVCKRALGPIDRIQETMNPLLIRFRYSPNKLR